MFCKKCGKEFEDGAKFCPNCGVSTINEPITSTNVQKSKGKGCLIAVIVFVLIFSLAMGLSATQNKNTKNTSNSTNTGSSEQSLNYINANETTTEKDWEFSIKDVYFGQRINPPVQPSFYNYYQVEDTNDTYLCVVISAKNLSNVGLNADKVANVKVKYNNNYTYKTFSTIPDSVLGFTYTNITSIEPLTSKDIYYLAKMPNSISEETDTPITIEITVNNTKYYYTYR